jgi:hypothetical protein
VKRLNDMQIAGACATHVYGRVRVRAVARPRVHATPPPPQPRQRVGLRCAARRSASASEPPRRAAQGPSTLAAAWTALNPLTPT